MLPLIPTTLVGSYPQPDWLIDRDRLLDSLPPRVRAKELWRVPEPYLAQAQDDATALAIRDLERVGLDILTDGEIRRESYSFLAELNECAVDQIAVESAQPQLDLAVLREIDSKTVILGVLDLSDEQPETADQVARRIDAALEFVPADRLQVGPDCGMKYLPREAALAKLPPLVDGARGVRGRLG
jgi:methionine synthase II (cobalamin-independent)